MGGLYQKHSKLKLTLNVFTCNVARTKPHCIMSIFVMRHYVMCIFATTITKPNPAVVLSLKSTHRNPLLGYCVELMHRHFNMILSTNIGNYKKQWNIVLQSQILHRLERYFPMFFLSSSICDPTILFAYNVSRFL